MADTPDDIAALLELQDAIYRDQIRMARQMTMEERLAEVFELSNRMFDMMHAGAMHQLGPRDETAGWEEVRRWMQRLDRARDYGLYVTEKPSAT